MEYRPIFTLPYVQLKYPVLSIALRLLCFFSQLDVLAGGPLGCYIMGTGSARSSMEGSEVFCIVTAMSPWVQSLPLFLVAEQFSVLVVERESSTWSVTPVCTKAARLCRRWQEKLECSGHGSSFTSA